MNIIQRIFGKKPAPPYIIEIYESKDGPRWRLLHANGENLADSESYSSLAKAEQTAINFSEWTGIEWRYS